ncbi:ATP-binding cassette sub-family G member 1-like [Hetaerina americana]|uniref:ATP-binding cassette sub-family G member 1-like n=1 Tax=Hetaerina americana TaxID=62018 RepID=UPI003A7F1AF6
MTGATAPSAETSDAAQDGVVGLAKPIIGGPQTTFSRLPQRAPIDLDFSDLNYTVSMGMRKGRKTILHGVTGCFPSSQLVAIMGPSGAGKSSLLDILTGYRTTGVEGLVCVNGEERDLAEFRRLSCYIMQEDRLQGLLTVAENMAVSAELKLGRGVSQEDKQGIIDEILDTLRLSETKNTRASMLSGGQKKRLSIALELVNNPLVMFLDEPTTGLDSSSCSQCVSLMKVLARQGRTIVATIHQPSASLFEAFDHVYVLAAGQCVYQGATSMLVPFLSSIDLECPMYNNPADYVIELACGEYGDVTGKMVEGADNGKCTRWFKNQRQPSMVAVRRESKTPAALSRMGVSRHSLAPVEPVLSTICGTRADGIHIRQETSQWNQLRVLLNRGFVKSKRDTTLTYMRTMSNLVVGLMLGLLYFGSGQEGSRVLDNYNLLFSILVHHMITAMMLTILTFPMEMSILLKEHFNRWYSIKSYYVAITITDLPVSIFGCVLFTALVYFMSAQPFEVVRFSMFTIISLLVMFVAQSFGLMIGAVFSVVNGTFLGPVLSIPMMMFAGFGVTIRDMPEYLRWGSYVSYLRYGLEGYVVSIYNNRETLDCDKKYCHYKYPQKFLREVDMEGGDFLVDVLALVAILAILRIAAYLLLRWKIMSER